MKFLIAVALMASTQAAPAQQQAHLLKSAHSLRCVFDSGWTAILDSTRQWRLKPEQPTNPEAPLIIEQLDRQHGRARMIDPESGGSDVAMPRQEGQLSFVLVGLGAVTVTTVYDHYAPKTDPTERELFAVQTVQGDLFPFGVHSTPFLSTWYGHCRVVQ